MSDWTDVYVVGQYKGGTPEAFAWVLIGVFSSEEKARAEADHDPGKFVIGPLQINGTKPYPQITFPRGLAGCL